MYLWLSVSACCRDAKERTQRTLVFLAVMQILTSVDIFVGSYSSNVSRLTVLLRASKDRTLPRLIVSIKIGIHGVEPCHQEKDDTYEQQGVDRNKDSQP